MTVDPVVDRIAGELCSCHGGGGLWRSVPEADRGKWYAMAERFVAGDVSVIPPTWPPGYRS